MATLAPDRRGLAGQREAPGWAPGCVTGVSCPSARVPLSLGSGHLSAQVAFPLKAPRAATLSSWVTQGKPDPSVLPGHFCTRPPLVRKQKLDVGRDRG